MRLHYLDWLRGVAVIAMVLAHTSDSWTLDADRRGEPWYTVAFIGGVASPLFLFLAGLATALSAASKSRRAAPTAASSRDAHVIGARQARRRGWQIFALGLLFRLQSQLLGLGPLQNLFKVDMLNIMGLAMVLAAWIWQVSQVRHVRLIWLGLATVAVAMITPIVRDITWLAALPDPLEAYLRPAGPYAAFPFFPWAGFLLAGVIVGELVDAVRTPASAPGQAGEVAAAARRPWQRLDVLQTGLVLAGGAAVLGGWWASWQPSIYPSSSFWNDSPTFFFIRLGLVTLLVPTAWVLEQLIAPRVFAPVVTLGHASLFVYWIHVEMVYGVAAEPLKRSLPLGQAIAATALLTCGLYGLVWLKNRYWPRLKRNQVGHLRHQRTVDHAAGS